MVNTYSSQHSFEGMIKPSCDLPRRLLVCLKPVSSGTDLATQQHRGMAALAGSVSAAGQHLWEEHVIAEVLVRLKRFPPGDNLTNSQSSACWART